MNRLLICMVLPFVLVSCGKHDGPTASRLKVSLSHSVRNLPLIFDSLMYQNGARELYSISRLNYFLSDIAFYKSGAPVYKIDTVVYIDAKNSYSLITPDVSPFSYDSISYSIGVPASYNAHGKLAPTYENIAMEWPDAMGGGYHFLKLEGHWKYAGSVAGYTVHLGTDAYLVRGGCRTSGYVSAGAENIITLRMDINEWLEHPNTYSFSTDGVYTMGNAALMKKISENGRDVIQVVQ